MKAQTTNTFVRFINPETPGINDIFVPVFKLQFGEKPLWNNKDMEMDTNLFRKVDCLDADCYETI